MQHPFCSCLLAVLAPVLALVPGASTSAAELPDPQLLRRVAQEARLDPAAAVRLDQVKLNAGLASIRFEDGVLVPATAVGGRPEEMVFLGQGRIVLEPPDAIEEGQLEIFTGGPRLDEEFSHAVLVVGLDGATDALLRRPRVAPLDLALAVRAAEVYAQWRGKPERKLLNVDGAVMMDAAGDAAYRGYFAAWFRGDELGDFLYLVEPDARDQVTLGRFVPLEATEKEKRKLLRQINREQRRGRLIGLELDDLGQWDTWISSPLRGRDGKPLPGIASFEPRKYTLEVSLGEGDLRLAGRARIDLQPAIRGSRAVALLLNSDLKVEKVTDGAGRDLVFHRTGRDLNVLLPGPAAEGETVTLVVEYSGLLIGKEGSSRALRDTLEWYPHAGSIDRALYDVTFRWPRKLDLVACGRRTGGGEEGGRRWERRVLDIPAAGFTFEVGRYRLETAQAGHVAVTVAFDPDGALLDRKVRDEIVQSVTGSLLYFEEMFGPYPLDELTVVTVPRDFSQATLGFVALSNLMMADLGIFNLFLGLEDRRTVIAHEIAHQWWGHLVGWESYRDQWISEAMANYASLLYARDRLEWTDRHGAGPTTGWREALTDTLPNGRSVESLGPVVLGERLFSSHSANSAYQAIVYQKGAVILDMLARSMGEESFPKILKQIVKVRSNRLLSTEDFLALAERITGAELDWFADQYVFGTGLPEVYYSYRFTPKGEGKWTVEGTARQQPSYHFRYRVERTDRGGFDVVRERVDQLAVRQSRLVVPVEVLVHDPTRPPNGRASKEKGNALVQGRLFLSGESADFAIEVPGEPRSFWLDRDAQVFGLFYDESRNPKRVLMSRGFDAVAAGRIDEAESLLRQALDAEVETSPEEGDGLRDLKKEGRLLDATVQLGLARLYLTAGRDGDAQAAYDKAHRVLGTYGGWYEEELKIIESRLEMRRGVFDKAFKRLRHGLLRSGNLDGVEGYLLLAIAAQSTGHKEEFEQAMKTARESGADVTLLAAR